MSFSVNEKLKSSCETSQSTLTTDVKNINLQIKKHKNMSFHFYKKTLKTCIKTLII